MFNIEIDWKTVLAILVAIIVLLWLARRQAMQAAAAAGDVVVDVGSTTLNPASRENFVYRGLSAVVDILDDGVDNDSNTVGTIDYDWELF